MSVQPKVPGASVSAGFAALGGAFALGAVLLARGRHRSAGSHAVAVRPASRMPEVRHEGLMTAPKVGSGVAVKAARRLNRAAGALAASVLFDSAVEHYRGSFSNKAMFTPLVASTASVLASMHGVADRRNAPHGVRDAVYAGAALTGAVGTGFHLYNIGKKPGGFCWQNLFYSAPIGAPAAMALSGLMGFLAERVRDNVPGTVPTVLGLPAGRAVAATTGAGLLGTVGEVGLLHFRGAYHNPFMVLPVTLPPIAAALMGGAAVGQGGARPWTRWWLRLTALLGVVGVGFHAMGVARNMGGWRNWSQNVLNGPPLPAPPAFTGLALAGLAGLTLLEEHPDD